MVLLLKINKLVATALLFIAGSTIYTYSQLVEIPTTYIKHGAYSVVVNICHKNQTCTIEQYNNVGTNLPIEYHKDRFFYERQGNQLILHNRNKHASSSVRKIYASSYYALCFYPKNQLNGVTDDKKIFPSLISVSGVLANQDGYYYALPLEFRAYLLFSDSCMYMRFGENESVLLNASLGEGISASPTLVEGAVANASGWSYFWNNRPRLTETINKAECIVGHVFLQEEDSIVFKKGGIGFRYDKLNQNGMKFKYSLRDSYVVIKNSGSIDTLLYHDAVLYDARVIQEKESAPRKMVIGPGGILQEPTGKMHISIYVDSSKDMHDIDSTSMIIRKYYFPINFHYGEE